MELQLAKQSSASLCPRRVGCRLESLCARQHRLGWSRRKLDLVPSTGEYRLVTLCNVYKVSQGDIGFGYTVTGFAAGLNGDQNRLE